MSHTLQNRKPLLARIRRIQGQTEALERAVEAGTDCGALLQQLSALRGAATGLMAEVLDSHLRETFGAAGEKPADTQAEIEQVMRIVRSYLR